MNEWQPLSSVAEIAWPAVPGPAAASMLAVQWQLEQAQWWPRERIVETQFRQLRLLLEHAVARVPHYRDALRLAGVKSVAEIDEVSFRRWPILRKGDVRTSETALQAQVIPREHGNRSHAFTSGSTGEPIRVVHTELTRFIADAVSIQDHLLHERDLLQKYGVLRSSVKRGSQPGWGTINALFATGPAVHQSSVIDVDLQLDWILAERPAYLQSYSSNLRALLQRSLETGKVPRGVRQLIGFGDMPPPDLPALARDAWGADFVATYSSIELGPIASQCPHRVHYLVHDPAVYVEILRTDGTPCAAGEVGSVVATPLHNFAMPLIRYEVGDFAELGPACPTGRGLTTLSRVIGRYRNMLRHPDGRLTRPSFPAKLWVEHAPVRKVRLLQRTLASIEVEYVMDRDLTAGEAEALRTALLRSLDGAFDIAFVRRESLVRAPGEKWEDFVSMVGDP